MAISVTPPPIPKPLDMENKRIFNLGAPVADTDAARKVDISAEAISLLSGTGTDITRKVVYYDFARNGLDTTRWVSTVSGGGSNIVYNTSWAGYLFSCTGTTANSYAIVSQNAAFRTDLFSNMVIEIDARVYSLVDTNTEIGFGIQAANTSRYAGTTNSILYGYKVDQTNANWQFRTSDATTALVEQNLTGMAQRVWYRIRFELTSTSAKVFLNNTQLGTTHTTNLPTSSTNIYVGWSVMNGATAADRSVVVRRVRVVLIP